MLYLILPRFFRGDLGLGCSGVCHGSFNCLWRAVPKGAGHGWILELGGLGLRGRHLQALKWGLFWKMLRVFLWVLHQVFDE